MEPHALDAKLENTEKCLTYEETETRKTLETFKEKSHGESTQVKATVEESQQKDKSTEDKKHLENLNERLNSRTNNMQMRMFLIL